MIPGTWRLARGLLCSFGMEGNPMRTTAYGFRCGAVERRGLVAIEWQHCCYHVKRHPSHAAGWRWESARTLREARKLAAMMRREAKG